MQNSRLTKQTVNLLFLKSRFVKFETGTALTRFIELLILLP